MNKQGLSKQAGIKPDGYTLLSIGTILNGINKLKCLFGLHSIQRFKHCNKYLVAGFCKNCCTVKVGNPVYYDGSFYQNTYKKEDALKFIDRDLSYVKSVLDRRLRYSKLYNGDDKIISEMVLRDETDILSNYETIESLENIKNHLKSFI